ncbi:MAG TPA: type II toxin-antitoxin system VapC family toxin [Solirubrobacterales bacterium]|nr:type II toxin-antitoxin system VapC family toxin [Solirubrobacterales bacterium]
MAALLLDTHVVHWWSAEPRRVSKAAQAALEAADDLVVAAITWYELAWLAQHQRIVLNVPVRSWLEGLGAQVRTIGITPAIADAAAGLPASFPGDPADRLIYATAIEHGLRLVTKDRAIARHDQPRSLVVW